MLLDFNCAHVGLVFAARVSTVPPSAFSSDLTSVLEIVGICFLSECKYRGITPIAVFFGFRSVNYDNYLDIIGYIDYVLIKLYTVEFLSRYMGRHSSCVFFHSNGGSLEWGGYPQIIVKSSQIRL